MLPDHRMHFSSAKFIVSTPSYLKIAAMILFLTSSIMFLSTPVCAGTPLWFGRLYPISAAVSGILIVVLYVVFAIGIAKHGYRIWTLIDLIFNMLDFTAMLVISIVTISECPSFTTSLQTAPAPMGIIGAILLATSSAIWFTQSRSNNDVSLAQEENTQGPHLYRKSVMV